MPSGYRFKLLTLIALFLLLSTCGAFAQVSLLPAHTIVVEGVTLIRDSHDSARWYFIPERPVLLERNPSDKDDPRPVFQLMTYQKSKDSNLYEGGVLQFCVSLSISDKLREKILNTLKAREDMKGLKVSLVPLPFNKAEAMLFDGKGMLNAQGTQSPGLAPAYVTGALPFQLKLDKFDSDLYETLVNTSGGGVGVLMKLGFEGVLPPAGFKVTINWDQTYDFLYENKETRVAIGTCNFGVDIGISKTKIRENLLSNGCMKVESLSNEAVKQEDIDRYLDPVIERIQQTLIAKIHPPERIDTESKNEPDSFSKSFFPAKSSVSVEMKTKNEVKTGSETFVYDRSVVVERNTSCGAFIGINSYSDAVKKRLVSTMPLDSWASAFLLLPGVDNSPELHISSVNMSAEVVDKNGDAISGLSDTAAWSAEKPRSWLNRDGEETASLRFPLMSLFKKHNNDIAVIRKRYNFKVDVSVIQSFGSGKLYEVKTSRLMPMFDGDLPLPATVNFVDPVVFDVSALTFNRSSGVKKVKVEIRKEGSSDKLEYSFPSKSGDESSVVFLVEAAMTGNEEPAAQILSTVTFETAKGKVLWQNNDKDLRGLEPSLYFMLFDSDWEAKP